MHSETHTASPLFAVVAVLSLARVRTILATLVSGYLAAHHQLSAGGTKSQRIFASIGLVLGHIWAVRAIVAAVASSIGSK